MSFNIRKLKDQINNYVYEGRPTTMEGIYLGFAYNDGEKCLFFADDVNLYTAIPTKEGFEDVGFLPLRKIDGYRIDRYRSTTDDYSRPILMLYLPQRLLILENIDTYFKDWLNAADNLFEASRGALTFGEALCMLGQEGESTQLFMEWLEAREMGEDQAVMVRAVEREKARRLAEEAGAARKVAKRQGPQRLALSVGNEEEVAAILGEKDNVDSGGGKKKRKNSKSKKRKNSKSKKRKTRKSKKRKNSKSKKNKKRNKRRKFSKKLK